jgi:hypothetical protein
MNDNSYPKLKKGKAESERYSLINFKLKEACGVIQVGDECASLCIRTSEHDSLIDCYQMWSSMSILTA